MKRVLLGGTTIVLMLVILQACAAVQYVDDQVTGNLYLRDQEYEEGARDFSARVRENPDQHMPNYYLGRYLLALDKPEEAKGYLQKAVSLYPDNAEYHFWLGVAYWGLEDPENERAEYGKALELDQDYLLARIYLAHNLLDSGDAQGALGQYDRVLLKVPEYPDALYNRAAALTLLGQDSDATQAWKQYLSLYPDGSLARKAALALNTSGNFSYRTQVIGVRRMVLELVQFEPGTAVLDAESYPSLDAVGEVMESNRRFRLAVNAFKEGDQTLAQARAQSVRNYLLDNFSDVSSDRITTEGFGRAEHIRVGGKTYALSESIVFQTIE